jgi:hypothetical protein
LTSEEYIKQCYDYANGFESEELKQAYRSGDKMVLENLKVEINGINK